MENQKEWKIYRLRSNWQGPKENAPARMWQFIGTAKALNKAALAERLRPIIQHEVERDGVTAHIRVQEVL